MKKLPALLLCALLFVAAVPISAYADEPPAALETAIMNLYDKTYVYDPAESLNDMKHLVNAYGALGGAYTGKVGFESIKALWDAVDASTIQAKLFEALQEGKSEYNIPASYLYFLSMSMNPTSWLLSGVTLGLSSPLSYDALAAVFSETIYGYSDVIGMGVIANSQLESDTVLEDAKAEAARIEKEVTDATAQVINNSIPMPGPQP